MAKIMSYHHTDGNKLFLLVHKEDVTVSNECNSESHISTLNSAWELHLIYSQWKQMNGSFDVSQY